MHVQEVTERPRIAGRPGHVRRDRLVERLLAGREAPVVVITAPAGFGKTTLLAEWSEADPRPFAVLTLAERHDDPILLTASLADAVAEHCEIGDDVYSALAGSRPGTLNVAVPRLLGWISEGPALVVALDDVHVLTDPDSLKVLEALARGMPPGSQLALASRSEPAIRLSRLRAGGALTELGARELAMNEAEAGRLLEACGAHLHEDSIRLLSERTEGWPAALYLATVSMRDADDPDRAALDFAGDNRLIADYLREELVAALIPEEREFLTRTSILDVLSGDLCDAVLATEGSAAILRDLARSNALISALDAKQHEFRCHALLREMLGAELRELHAREAGALHARAGRWYADHADFDRAVPHAIAAGDTERAAELIWSLTPHYESAGRGTTVRGWLARFSEAERHASVPLCLAAAAAATTDGDGPAVEHWLSAAFDGLKRAGPARSAEQEAAAILLRATAVPRSGVVAIGSEVERIAGMLAAPWAVLARYLRGVSLHLSGQPQDARGTLEEAARLGASETPNIETLCRAQLALIALDEDDREQAAAEIERALATAERFALREQAPQAVAAAVSALIHAGNGRTPEAAAEAKLAADLLDELTDFAPWYVAEGRVVLARALLLLDNVGEARAALAAAGPPLHRVTDAETLRRWAARCWEEADAARAVSGRWPLTPAELRLLHHLPTHLSFREIADELYVSTNTIKTQASSIYRKLGTSGRAETVACAQAAGLLDRSDDKHSGPA